MKKIREIEKKKKNNEIYSSLFYIFFIETPIIFFVKFLGILGILCSYVASFAILGYIYYKMIVLYLQFLYTFKLNNVTLTEAIEIVIFLGILFIGIVLYFLIHGIWLLKAMDFFFPFLDFPNSYEIFKNRLHNRKIYKTRYQRVLSIPFAIFTKERFNDIDFSINGNHIISGNLVAIKFKNNEIRLTLENFGCYRDILVYKKDISNREYVKLLQSSDFITYPVDIRCTTKNNVITYININFASDWYNHPYDPEIRLIKGIDARQIDKFEKLF